MFKSPKFWQNNQTLLGKILSPFGFLYGHIVSYRLKKSTSYDSSIPVVCVGNLVLGGVGKTPLAISIAEYFKSKSLRPVFLTRGYGGGASNIVVDTAKHTYKETGDEALLLAKVAPVIVDFDRKRGAKKAEKLGADVIIMDDGFQNPQLKKDLSLAVFDGRYGFGNGRVFPAGPLREPIEEGLNRADAYIVVGKDKAGVKKWVDESFPDLPFIATHIEQDVVAVGQLSEKKIFAFAGIGYPDKFFDMLKDYGCDVVGTQAFSDHYPYTDEDLTSMLEKADKLDAIIVTTAKDSVRLPPRFKPLIRVVDAYMVWDTPNTLNALLSELHK